jgi:hypothetical protein
MLSMTQSPVFKNLIELDLQWNGITTQGALYLGNSKVLLSLQFLRMWGNEIGEKGVAAIKTKLKGIKNPLYPSAASD